MVTIRQLQILLDVCGMKGFLIIENMIIIYVILLLYSVQGRYIYIIADHIFSLFIQFKKILSKEPYYKYYNNFNV